MCLCLIMTSPAAFSGFESFKLSGVEITDTVLGQGSYATVLEVRYKGQKCAGKKVHELLLVQGNNTYALRRFEEECRLLSQVHHPNVVRFLGVYFVKSSDAPILVMEFLPTNLTLCMEQRGVLASAVNFSIIYDVARGLNYLHSHAPVIIHRDLTSNNVLLTEDLSIAKIADLGVARMLNKTPQRAIAMTGNPGTPAYMPPEVMGAYPKYDAGVDTFSFGVLMIHVFCGSWPEPQVGPVRTEGDKMIPVSEAERREVFLEAIGYDHPLMELIQVCISNNPQSRPSSGEIVMHLEKLMRRISSVVESGKYLTLKMPPISEVDDNRKVQKRKVTLSTYEDILIQVTDNEGQPDPQVPDKKPEGNTKVLSREKNIRLEGSKVKISTSWAQKKFKQAIAVFSLKDQSKAVGGASDSPEAVSVPSYPMYVAKYDYESRTHNDTSLRRGDKVCIVNKDDESWWLARSPDTGRKAYIPSNYLVELRDPVYTALRDFKPKKARELSFKRGEELVVVHTGNGQWWFAHSRASGKEGYVPWSYLAEPSYPIYAARYDYVSFTHADLSFRKNDQLCVIYVDNEDWWFSRSMETGKEGFVPSNYLTKVTYPIYAAMYDYKSRTGDDLGFEKSDLLCIVNADNKEWWVARSKETGKEGYIPCNYVAKVNSLNIFKWYVGSVSRMEAERQLFERENKSGSYLVRHSQSVVGGYTLSVKVEDRVKHYKIQQEGKQFFITKQTVFKSIPDLICHYQSQSDGLRTSLAHPCVSSRQPQTAGLSKLANEEWNIDRKNIKLVKKIGDGRFAKVSEGVWNDTLPVAIKTLGRGVVSVADFLQKAAQMRELRHSNVLQLYAVCTKKEPVCIVTELVRCGSLYEYLQSRRGELEPFLLISMAEQVAEGMAYLEERYYIHRDLSARNVLVGDGLICKISDFGLLQLFREAECKYGDGAKYAIKWTSPEALLYDKFSVKSDVWSFGIVLYEIITFSGCPYPGMSNKEVTEKVSQGYRMPQPENCSCAYYNIMLECWREEPENRPTFEALRWELEELLESTR